MKKLHFTCNFWNCCLIIGAICSKIPQIGSIYRNKSAKGISLCSVTLDLISKTILAFYLIVRKYPLKEWCEILALALCTLIIEFQVLYYNGRRKDAWLILTGYVTACNLLISGLIPLPILWVLESMCIPLQLASKITQAVSISNNGGTGNISGLTTFVMCISTVMKTYSEYYSRCDYLLVANNGVTFAGNLLIGIQIIYYMD
ncbi:hypothetical protein RI129_004072 [Pyrocoelia pectoralis]|uniref:PQ-loop repeat-containing protein 3 n=1 Tax=Pyrocoelia pectoralis TaxID=417401 RepID=A0AAN7ZPF9_9COLE